MMSMVTPLTRSVDREIVKKLFQKFSAVYGNLWINRCGTSEEWYACATVWLDGLREFELDILKKAVVQAFIAHKDYPPTLGQMVNICLHQSGVPSESQIFEALVRRDFNHPLTKIIYDGVDSWFLSHGKPEEIKNKVKEMYSKALSSFQENPKKAWKLLDDYKALSEPILLPSKIPSKQELIGWKERFARYKEMSVAEKAAIKPVDHPVWVKAHITMGHPDFDEKVFNDRKQYLTGMDEHLAMTLPQADQYDRIRLLREELAHRHVEKLQQGSYVPPKKKEPTRSFNGSKVVYKHWMGD